MKNITIIGGGIIGLNCAYYLQKEGYAVTVIERGDITNGCSFGNMGYFSPSHFIPLASPGLIEGRCAMTPWGQHVRIGGTMEISGINETILPKRMKGIYDSVKDFYPGLKIYLPPADKIWHGLRPVTPDGLPYIGRLKNFKNVVIAGGHAMMGVSLAPGTGKLVTEIIGRKNTTIDM